jgi:hypothetical protein
VEADPPDTPNLNQTTSSTNPSKRGGKRLGAGRGRSNPAPTPSERDEKDSPRNGNDGGGETPVPSVIVNGIGASKRGKRGQQHPRDESGESDKDANNSNNNNNANGITGSDADTPVDVAGTSSHTNTSKKKEPSMNELKRRAAAMLEWIEKAKEDLSRSSVVRLSMSASPIGGAASPPSMVKSELGSVAEMLHSRLLGWQVE